MDSAEIKSQLEEAKEIIDKAQARIADLQGLCEHTKTTRNFRDYGTDRYYVVSCEVCELTWIEEVDEK